MRKVSSLLLASLFVVGCGSNDQSTEKNSASSYQSSVGSSQSGMTASIKSPELIKRKEALKQEGMEHLSKAEVNEAIGKFVEMVKLDPTDTQTYFLLTQTYIRLQSYDNAIGVLDTILKMEPENGTAYYLKAVTCGLSGNRDEAIASAEKSVELFKAQRSEENFKKSLVLLQSLIDQSSQVTPKDVSATTTNQ